MGKDHIQSDSAKREEERDVLSLELMKLDIELRRAQIELAHFDIEERHKGERSPLKLTERLANMHSKKNS